MSNEKAIQKLCAYIEKVLAYCAGIDYAQFCADSKLVEACVFNLSQMGEMVKYVDKAFADKHTEIPWRTLYGLRNRIVHDYEGVNPVLIWEIISEDLCDLLRDLKKLLPSNEP